MDSIIIHHSEESMKKILDRLGELSDSIIIAALTPAQEVDEGIKMTDTFRKEYRPLKDENTKLILECKEKDEELEVLFKNVASWEMSLALTNLEQALMWSTKAIVLNDEKG